MRLLFIRHAESEANRLRQISNRGCQPGLTATGQAQAAALAQRLAGQPLAAVHASPLQRAVETARPLATATGAPLAVAPALREFDCGVYEGRGDPEAWAAHARILAAWIDRGQLGLSLEGGESGCDLVARFEPFMRAVMRAHPPESRVALVTHGGLLRVVLPALVPGLPAAWQAWHMPHTGTTVISANAATGELSCLEWGDGWPASA